MISSKEYEIISVEDYGTNKKAHLVCKHDETQHTVTVFPDYDSYKEVEKGSCVHGWVRRKGSYYNLVSYCKPERNWAENEEFI